MTFELTFTLFWVILIFFGLKSSIIFKNNLELNKLTAYGFLIKSIGIVVLMLVFQDLAPASNLFIDTKGYMRDTAYLNDVFYVSPIIYFKFLTGIGETNELVLNYLSGTYLWDNGHSLYNDSKNVVRFNSLIYFISRGNVYVHIVFMSLFSTLGIRFIVLAFKKYVLAIRTLFFILLFLSPSLFVASGGVLKEPFLIFGIGLFLYSFSSEISTKKRIFVLAFALLFLVFIKPYVLVTILIGMSFLLFSKYVFAQKPWLSLLLYSVFLSVLFLSIKPLQVSTVQYISRKQLDMERISNGGLYVFENKDNPRILFFKLEELDKLEIKNDSIKIIAPLVVGKSTMVIWDDLKILQMEPSEEKWKIYAHFPEKASSFFQTAPIRNSLYTFIVSSPKAFIDGLLRPFPTDAGSSYKYPAMLEVYFCLGIFALSLFYRKKTTIFEKRVLGSLALFIFILLVLIGFTTPVVGALVRYRIPAFIALFIASFIILKIPEKWKNRIQ
jgi:hypothetical protein